MIPDSVPIEDNERREFADLTSDVYCCVFEAPELCLLGTWSELPD